MQVPSSVSAIKVDGRRAHDLIRSGETVQLAARPVVVSRFEVVGAPRRGERVADLPVGDLPVVDLDVEVDCSSGTYVRSLARDLGAAIGVGGHLTRLRRTRVGPFDVDSAVDVFGSAAAAEPPSTGRAASSVGAVDVASGTSPSRVRTGVPRPPVTASFAASIAQAVIPAAQAVRQFFGHRVVGEKEAGDLRHGRTIEAAGLPGTYAVFDPAGELIALASESGGVARSVLGWQVNG
jgi:tRNA pseudouridine55 synthase